MEDVCRPLIDQVQAWEGIAAAEYAVDGSMDGWDDDKIKYQSSEDSTFRYLNCYLLSPAVFLELAVAASSVHTTAQHANTIGHDSVA